MKPFLLVLIAIALEYSQALIVPQEIPSVLSLVFSTIPQVRKGTDSRIGFGFRFGEHADFQVMFELGPQKETRPIGTDASSSSNSKRQVSSEEYEQVVERSPNKEGSSYLKNWSNDMLAKKNTFTTPEPETLKGMRPFVQTSPIISQSALKQLQILYKKTQNQSTNESSEAIANSQDQEVESEGLSKTSGPGVNAKDKTKITADLMDVDLD